MLQYNTFLYGIIIFIYPILSDKIVYFGLIIMNECILFDSKQINRTTSYLSNFKQPYFVSFLLSLKAQLCIYSNFQHTTLFKYLFYNPMASVRQAKVQQQKAKHGCRFRGGWGDVYATMQAGGDDQCYHPPHFFAQKFLVLRNLIFELF